MKPSERRALKAQKEAEKLQNDQYAINEPIADNQQEQQQTKRRTPKSFFSDNARLIAFIVTSFLIITVFSPFAVDMFLERQKDKGVVRDKKDITIEQVYAVADNIGSITWKSFESFNYTDRSRDDGKYYTREYPIADTLFVLQVGGKTMSGLPEYIYLISLTDSQYVNVAKDNVRQFVKKYQDNHGK